jgi:hypothetical protein
MNAEEIEVKISLLKDRSIDIDPETLDEEDKFNIAFAAMANVEQDLRSERRKLNYQHLKTKKFFKTLKGDKMRITLVENCIKSSETMLNQIDFLTDKICRDLKHHVLFSRTTLEGFMKVKNKMVEKSKELRIFIVDVREKYDVSEYINSIICERLKGISKTKWICAGTGLVLGTGLGTALILSHTVIGFGIASGIVGTIFIPVGIGIVCMVVVGYGVYKFYRHVTNKTYTPIPADPDKWDMDDFAQFLERFEDSIQLMVSPEIVKAVTWTNTLEDYLGEKISGYRVNDMKCDRYIKAMLEESVESKDYKEFEINIKKAIYYINLIADKIDRKIGHSKAPEQYSALYHILKGLKNRSIFIRQGCENLLFNGEFTSDIFHDKLAKMCPDLVNKQKIFNENRGLAKKESELRLKIMLKKLRIPYEKDILSHALIWINLIESAKPGEKIQFWTKAMGEAQNIITQMRPRKALDQSDLFVVNDFLVAQSKVSKWYFQQKMMSLFFVSEADIKKTGLSLKTRAYSPHSDIYYFRDVDERGIDHQSCIEKCLSSLNSTSEMMATII